MTFRILDLFCGGGGASAGYAKAGLEIHGVDLSDQPHYPFHIDQGDALEYLAANHDAFDAFVASPPCRDHSILAHCGIGTDGSGSLLARTRSMLQTIEKPWVMENVVGAYMPNSVLLCGSMFDLGTKTHKLKRHRQFETSFPVPQPLDHCSEDRRPVIGLYGGRPRDRRSSPTTKGTSGTTLPFIDAQQAMEIDWLPIKPLCQAIPPAYTDYIGRYLLKELNGQAMPAPTIATAHVQALWRATGQS